METVVQATDAPLRPTPLELWHSFVDTFAALHAGAPARWVAEGGTYPDTQDNRDVNALLGVLSPAQRRVLADMLAAARRGGVHDALARLNDRMAIQNGCYAENGVTMAFQPYGNPLHYDYAGRRDGAEWSELAWSGIAGDQDPGPDEPDRE